MMYKTNCSNRKKKRLTCEEAEDGATSEEAEIWKLGKSVEPEGRSGRRRRSRRRRRRRMEEERRSTRSKIEEEGKLKDVKGEREGRNSG